MEKQLSDAANKKPSLKPDVFLMQNDTIGNGASNGVHEGTIHTTGINHAGGFTYFYFQDQGGGHHAIRVSSGTRPIDAYNS